jgi:hypothetical protein
MQGFHLARARAKRARDICGYAAVLIAWTLGFGCSSDDPGAANQNPQMQSGAGAAEPSGTAGQAGATPTAAGTSGSGAGTAAAGRGAAAAGASGARANTAGTSTPAAGGAAAGTSAAAGSGSAAGAGGIEPKAGDGAAGAAGGAVDETEATLIPDPSWTCGMPEGVPPPSQGTPLFEVTLAIDPVLDAGMTPLGHRRVVPSKGGMFTGSKLSGRFLTGGLGYDLELANGTREVEEVQILETQDNASIFLRACGLSSRVGDVTRIVGIFEAASSGRYGFLNTGKFVGTRTLDVNAKTLKLAFFELGAAAMPAMSTVKIVEPMTSGPQASWDCKDAVGRQGPLEFMEDVLIGSGIAVGETPGGTRNIIPITGGTFSGDRIEGDVLVGGADYQLSGSGGYMLDARYTLRTKDGELVVVRNCGPASQLVPFFETRADGPYAWLNTSNFLSTVGVGVGRVYISIYQAN